MSFLMDKCCSKCKNVFVLLLMKKSGPKAFVIVFRQPHKNELIYSSAVLIDTCVVQRFHRPRCQKFPNINQLRTKYLEINKLFMACYKLKQFVLDILIL